MRKIISLITFLSLACIMPAWAQSGGIEFGEKANVVKIGPKVGVGFTSMGQPNEADVYDGSGAGLVAGLAVKSRFGRATEDTRQGGTGLLGVGMELLYKKNEVKTVDGSNLSLGYFEIPVTLQFFPMTKSKMMNPLFIEAGLDFAFLTSKSPALLQVPSANLAYKTGDLKGGDVRIVAGFGYTVPKTSLDVGVRYYIGTSNLAGNFPCKQNTLEVSLAWLFKIASF
jgi:hypothetical protein